jgi:hypothetical protein
MIPAFYTIYNLTAKKSPKTVTINKVSRQELGIFLFTTASRMALGPTQLLFQWVPVALSLGIKRPRREADHSAPSSAEVKECVELYLHSPTTPSWRGAHGQFYLFLYQPSAWTELTRLLHLINISCDFHVSSYLITSSYSGSLIISNTPEHNNLVCTPCFFFSMLLKIGFIFA